MRTSPLFRSIFALSLLTLAVDAHAAGDQLPVRKPGLWKITSISASLGTASIEACIGPADSIAATTSPGTCAEPAVKRAGDQTIVTVVCTDAAQRETTSTLFTGDFATWYRGIVKMTSEPPAPGGNIGVTLDAKYAGPCK